jgi:hypothetical protein
MSTHYLQLLDFPLDPKYLTGPRACIALKSYSTLLWADKTGKKKVDFKIISPDCVTFNELQYQADLLIKELETIKRQAKSFFQKELENKRTYFKTDSR